MNVLRAVSLAALLAGGVVLTGCNSDSSSSERPINPGPSKPTMTGYWTGKTSDNKTFAFDIEQKGSALTGSYTAPSRQTGRLSGQITGNELYLMTTLTGGTNQPVVTEWAGVVNTNRTKMNGSFTVITGGSGSGIWTAEKFMRAR